MSSGLHDRRSGTGQGDRKEVVSEEEKKKNPGEGGIGNASEKKNIYLMTSLSNE